MIQVVEIYNDKGAFLNKIAVSGKRKRYFPTLWGLPFALLAFVFLVNSGVI